MEDLSPEKTLLQDLERTHHYVFHGSPLELAELEPRQAHDVVRGADGKPAIFASQMAEYAIFMAILNKHNCPEGVRTNAGSVTDERGNTHLVFGATQSSLDQLRPDASGWVYVFAKEGFVPREGMPVEFIRTTDAEPLNKIHVHLRDMPKNIEILREDA